MLLCPKCHRNYEQIYRFCPLDGTELEAIDLLGDPLLKATVGKYRVIAKVYESDVEVVYRAEDPGLKRRVFLWMYDATFVSQLSSYERFKKEALRSNTIAHKNIAAHLEVGPMEDGRCFLVTEVLDRVLLVDLIKKEHSLSQKRVIHMARQICSALKAVHEQGIYHGNLNPHYFGVSLDDQGYELVKVCGFGVAKFKADYKLALVEKGRESEVSPRDVAYISPEHASGGSESTIDDRDDVYSLGILLYEMLSGELPFQAESAQSMIDAHSLVEPVSIRNLKSDLDLSPRLDSLVLRALAKNRRKRCESVAELLLELDELSREVGLPERGVEAATPVQSDATRKPASVLAGSKAGTAPPKSDAESADSQDIESAIRKFTRPAMREEPPAMAAKPSQESGTDHRRASRFLQADRSWARIFVYATLLAVLFITAFTFSLFWVRLRPKYGRLSIKTDPPDAVVLMDGLELGKSPFLMENVLAGKHLVKAIKEGYQADVQPVDVKPDVLETVFFKLRPTSATRLSSEQSKRVSDFMRRAEVALKENILIPPPDDYNVLYFCNKILEIDPTDQFAVDMRNTIADKYRSLAGDAFQKGNWFKAEEYYKNVALIFPNDEAVQQKLAELEGKIQEFQKERQQKITELTAKIKQALQNGQLIPPEPENAIDNVNILLRLDKKNAYGKQAKDKVKELLQKRAEAKIAASNWEGARSDYLALQQYFPADRSLQGKLEMINGKLNEQQKLEDARRQQQEQEKQRRAQVQEMKQLGIDAFKAKDYNTAISVLTKVVATDNSNDELYYYLGAAYLQTERIENAITNFEKCVSLNSRHALAHLNLGILYDSQRQNYTLAKQHLSRARDLGGVPGYPPERIARLIQEMESKERLASMAFKPIPIEHKHFGSSCSGHLYVSGSGIRYETKSEHGFSESLENVKVSLKSDHFELRFKNKKFNFRCLNQEDNETLRRWLRLYKKIQE